MIDRQELAPASAGSPERQRECSRRVTATLGFVTKDEIIYPPGYEPDSTREWRPYDCKKIPPAIGPFVTEAEVRADLDEREIVRRNLEIALRNLSAK